MKVTIRHEERQDIDAIHSLTKIAFADMPYSSHTEHFIVDELRKCQALTLSLVALDDADIVGHVAFSPVIITDGSSHWFALGPVSVIPQKQKQGIGAGLIDTGLQQLKRLGASGCVLVGDPNYYAKFGFKVMPGFSYPDLPVEYFQALAFDDSMPQGEVAFHEAFSSKAP